MTEMILAYVPESEHLDYDEALALALKRDQLAAEQLRLSVPDSEKPLGYSPLVLPLDLRKAWGKI